MAWMKSLFGSSQDLDTWLITNGDGFRPLRIGLCGTPNGRTSWLLKGGDPTYLLTGMILQVCPS